MIDRSNAHETAVERGWMIKNEKGWCLLMIWFIWRSHRAAKFERTDSCVSSGSVFFILSWSAKCVDLWEGEADRAIKKTAFCGQPMLLFSWPNGEVRYFFTWWRWGGSNPCPETVPHTDVYSLSHVWIIQQFAHELTAAECVSEFSCREAKRIHCLEFHWILLTATAQNTLLTGGCEPIVGY